MLRTLLWAVFLAAVWHQAAHARPLKAVEVFKSDELRTDAVKINGERKEKSQKWCIKADPQSPFAQRTIRTNIAHQHDADEARCDLGFSDYVDIAPGVAEPTTACVQMFVRSVGGFLVANNKRGHLTCGISVQRHDSPPLPAPVGNNIPLGKGDAVASVLSLPADLTLRRSDRSSAVVAWPLRSVAFQITEAIKTGVGEVANDVTLTIKDARLDLDAAIPTEIVLFVNFDADFRKGKTGAVGFNCLVTTRLAIPAAAISEITIQGLGTVAECKTGNDLLAALNVRQLVANEIRSKLSSALEDVRSKSPGSELLLEWSKQDPELAEVVGRALLQGRHCIWRGEPALCIAIGWENAAEINEWQQRLLSKVPVATVAADKAHAISRRDALLSWAMLRQRQTRTGDTCTAATGCAPGVCDKNECFMTGLKENFAREDGDLTIFAGVLCSGGVEEGCRLVRAAQTDDGRFWRSPWRIGEQDSKDHATFSGDQLKGAMHYFASGSGERDTKMLSAFLRFLKTQPTNVPSDALILERGYSSCTQRSPNFTCLIGGDWTLLDLLAKKYGLADDLPSELPGMLARYGTAYDTLVWESLMTNTGYRLHLVANTVWLLRKLGQQDARIDLAAKLIAARQPKNPFFLWLLLGSDALVQRELDAKCPNPSTALPRIDWAWQRAETDAAWTKSMVWDCVFGYSLLAQ